MKEYALQLEIQKDLDTLSDLVGYPITGHVYPGGGHTEAAEQYLREKGILYGRSVLGKSSFYFPENPYRYVPTIWFGAKDIFEQLDTFVHTEADEQNMLFCVWGHGHELDFGTETCNWNYMEKLLKTAAEKSNLTFCTLSEAFQGNLQNYEQINCIQ